MPATARLGDTFARVRLSDNPVAGYDGFGGFGEVEDYQVPIEDEQPDRGVVTE